MIRAALIAVVIAALPVAHADFADAIGQAQRALAMGHKREAYDLLLPLAKQGNADAMYRLAFLIAQSPEYPNNTKTALGLLQAAAKRGHKAAEVYAAELENVIADAREGIATANRFGTAAQQQFKAFQDNVLRFTENLPDVPRVEAHFFMPSDSQYNPQVFALADALKSKFGVGLASRFHVLIDPAKWSPESGSRPLNQPFPYPVSPDFGGRFAKQAGVTSLPSVVLFGPSGEKLIVTNLNAAADQISQLLKRSALYE